MATWTWENQLIAHVVVFFANPSVVPFPLAAMAEPVPAPAADVPAYLSRSSIDFRKEVVKHMEAQGAYLSRLNTENKELKEEAAANKELVALLQAKTTDLSDKLYALQTAVEALATPNRRRASPTAAAALGEGVSALALSEETVREKLTKELNTLVESINKLQHELAEDVNEKGERVPTHTPELLDATTYTLNDIDTLKLLKKSVEKDARNHGNRMKTKQANVLKDIATAKVLAGTAVAPEQY